MHHQATSAASRLRLSKAVGRSVAAAVIGASCFAASPALANAAADARLADFADPDLKGTFEGDYVIVAVGSGYVSDYDGSDDYGFELGGALRGEVGGIGFATRGIGLELDLIPNLPGNVELSFGPDVRYSMTRSGKVDDEIVNLLPRLDKTVEAGFGAGISVKNVITPLDSISLSTGARWDISGNGAGRSTSLQLSYFTALSPGMGAGISAGTSWADDKYADYYYSVTPEGSAATGGALPVYEAKGGRKDWDVKVYYGLDFDGDFRNGGFGIAAALSYERLRGSAAETPLTSLRGDRNQYAALIGLGYIF